VASQAPRAQLLLAESAVLNASTSLRSTFSALYAALGALNASNYQNDSVVLSSAAQLAAELALLAAAIPAAQASLAPLNGSHAYAVGAWNRADVGEVIVLDIPFNVFAVRQQFYSQGFCAALASCLNVSVPSVYVNNFQQSAAGTTSVYFTTLMYGTDSSSSAVVTHEFASVQSLFLSPTTGAAARPQLIAALQSFGVPATAAYYNFQNVAPYYCVGGFYLSGSTCIPYPAPLKVATVTTFAGSTNTSGYADGSVSSALFSWPFGLAVDSASNLYIGSDDENRIRKINNSSKVVSTFVGSTAAWPNSIGSQDGVGTTASFYLPNGVAVDKTTGNVYITCEMGGTVRKVTPGGVVTTLAGAGSVNCSYSAQSGTSCTRTVPAGFTDGVGTNAVFNGPWGIAVDTSGSNLYVVDNPNGIRMINIASRTVSTLFTGYAPGRSLPFSVVVNGSDYVFFANTTNIFVASPTGLVSVYAGNATCLTYAEGTLQSACFTSIQLLAVDGAGTLYVMDSGRLRMISGGVTSYLAGGMAGNPSPQIVNGVGTAANFFEPWGLVVGGAGILYVSDWNCIRKVTLS
jgi:DNA-binding beta-propeller fold protein YncE